VAEVVKITHVRSPAFSVSIGRSASTSATEAQAAGNTVKGLVRDKNLSTYRHICTRPGRPEPTNLLPSDCRIATYLPKIVSKVRSSLN
jgi:hypothetical protein